MHVSFQHKIGHITSDFNVGCRNADLSNTMMAANNIRRLSSVSLVEVIFKNCSSSNTPVSKYCTMTKGKQHFYSGVMDEAPLTFQYLSEAVLVNLFQYGDALLDFIRQFYTIKGRPVCS